MYDINKSIANERLAQHDPDGHLYGLDHWSPRTARRMAAEEGIALDDEHWQVIYCLRERFREQGPDWTARELTRDLERDFADAGGRRYLYQLFPRGPIAQACRLAGLPLPHGTISPSFGSVH
jgi:tRNA 2-thiouridine synthesizing protein E